MSSRLSRPLLLIGCGKMGGAMLSGWLESGVTAAGVVAVDPFAKADGILADRAVALYPDAAALPDDLNPEVVVLAVKPQQMDDMIGDYVRFAGPDTLFLSIAAGKTIPWFESHLGKGAAVVRAMPNTPAAIGRGITVCCPNERASEPQRQLSLTLLRAVGEAGAVEDEALMDAVTALSGSGPAYVFLLMECMTEAGIKAGLPEALAAQLALHTVAGAGQLAMDSTEPPAQLRKNVTSPGGTTAAALEVLMRDENNLQDLMAEAVEAATRRSRQLAG